MRIRNLFKLCIVLLLSLIAIFGFGGLANAADGVDQPIVEETPAVVEDVPAVVEETPAPPIEETPAVVEEPLAGPIEALVTDNSPELFDGWVTWQTPNYVPVNPTLGAIGLPQWIVGFGQISPEECGVTYQQDHYVGTQAAVNAVLDDGMLGGTVQHPEDSGIVTEWAFVSSDPCPEVVTYNPTCTSVDNSVELTGDGVIDVAGDWNENWIDVPFSGTLADIGTVLNIDASPLQYVGLHIDTDQGSIVFEEEASYNGQLWSNSAWDGVDAGLGYAALGSIEDYVELNGDVTVTGIRLLYTSPEESSTTVDSFTIGCTTYTFVPEVVIVVDPPVDEPPVVEPPVVVPPVVDEPVVVPPVVDEPVVVPPVVDEPVVVPPVTEIANVVAQPQQAALAHTGSAWDRVAPYALGFVMLGIVLIISAAGARRYDKNHMQSL